MRTASEPPVAKYNHTVSNECIRSEMPTPNTSFKIAAVQAAPVFLNREATLDKACELIMEAGRSDARLVAFPESFIPAYPDWVWAVPAGEEGVLNGMIRTTGAVPESPGDSLAQT